MALRKDEPAEMELEAAIDLRPWQLQEVRRMLAEILPGVVAWAYGSRVKGTARRTSDLDLVVFVEPGDARVEAFREELEESDLPFVVDVHVWHDLPAEWRAGIERDKFVVMSLHG